MTQIAGSFSKDRIAQIAKEVDRRSKARRDYVADRSNTKIQFVDGELAFRLNMPDGGEPEMFTIRRPALGQMCQAVKVPMRYVNRLLDGDTSYGDMVAYNLNELFSREPRRHLIRTLDGKVDAFLSDRYRAFDNRDLLACVLRELKQAGAEVWDMRLTDDHFRLLAVAPHISGQVTTDRTFDPGDGWRSRWYGNEGDVLNAAITLGNSPTGHGATYGNPSIMRRVCANFCVWVDGVARVHLGGRIEGEGEVFISEETRRQEDRVLYMKIADVIRNTFDPAAFAARIELMNAATTRVIDKPTEAVNSASVKLGLPEEHIEAILEDLLQSGDKTQYGLVQSITALVNPMHAGLLTMNDEERSLIEDAGGKVMAMTEAEFGSLIRG